MSLTRINNNIGAVTASRNLNAVSTKLQKNIERLSSGLRINRAGDDAAGLTIRERLRVQIRGVNQAILNAQNGISMSNTAEAALDQLVLGLQRIRELAIAAGNTGSNDYRAIQAIQDEVFQQIDEVNRIAETSQFGTRVLFNGDNANSSDVRAGQDPIGVNISDDPNASNLRSGTSILNIIRTQAGRQTLLPAETRGSQQIFATGVRDATDIAVSSLQIRDTAGNRAALADNIIGSQLGRYTLADGTIIPGYTLAATDRISFQGVLSDGVTPFAGSYSIGVGATWTNMRTAIQAAIDSAENALFGGGTIPSSFVQTRVSMTDGAAGGLSGATGANAGGRFYFAGNDGTNDVMAPSGFDISFTVVDGGTVFAQQFGVTRDLVDGDNVGGQIGNTVNSITGSTFDTGNFAISVTDVVPPARREVESLLTMTDRTGAILARDASLGTAGLNGVWYNGVWRQYFTLTTGDTITIEGTNADGTSFSSTLTYDTTVANADNLIDGHVHTISGMLRELNWRDQSSAFGTKSAGDQWGFKDARFTYTGAGTFQLIDDIADFSESSFLIRVNDTTGVDLQNTINDRAELIIAGNPEQATIQTAGGPRQRVTVGDFVVLAAATPTVFGETPQRLAMRVGGGDRDGVMSASIFNNGTDTLEVEAKEFIGSLNSGPLVTFQNGDADVFFVSGVSEGVAETLLLDFDIMLDVTGPPTTGSPNTGLAILISTISRNLNFQVGAFAGQDLQVNMPDLRADNLGFGRGSGRTVDQINVSTVSGVNEALEIVDEALDQISRARATLGAFVNRLESTISNLSVSSENLTSSESRLSDVDIASETTSYTLHQILYQAGTSVLSQANFLPQTLLSLLGG
ncbi:MAG TPA: flagellin [bacterium]|nr:flagellin [bacterium]HQP99231.1 flagellin [bacterium]